MNHRPNHRHSLIILTLLLGLGFAFGLTTLARAQATLTVLDLDRPTAVHAPTVGTTYYVNAATGDDSRSEAQAQNPGTPWKTITHAVSTVPAGVAGDPNTISVAAGTHDAALGEVFPITLDNVYVNLVGAGASSTTIDGGGTTDILHITADGIHIEGFTMQNASADGIHSTNGGFTVTLNSFSNLSQGIDLLFQDQNFAGNTLAYPDMAIISNTFVVSNTGLYVNSLFRNGDVYSTSNISIGDFEVHSNTMTLLSPGSDGVDYELYVYDLLDGQFVMGDFNFTGNQVSGPFYDGFYIYAAADGISGTTELTAGHVNILDNQFLGSGGGETAIEIYYLTESGDFHGQVAATIGDLRVSDNFVSNAERLLYTYPYAPSDLYDSSSMTAGDVIVDNNRMVSWSSGGDAIRVAPSASDLYGDAQVTAGEVRITNNVFTAAGGTRAAIQYDPFIEDIYDDASVSAGVVIIEDNHVDTFLSGFNNALYVSPLVQNLNGAASVTLDSVFIQDNHIAANRGIEFALTSVGRNVISSTTTTIHPIYVLSNTIVATETESINVYFGNFAYRVEDNAVFDFGDIHIQANDLLGGMDSVIVESFQNVYGDVSATAVVTMPGIHLVNNVIADNHTGIRVDIDGPINTHLVHNTLASADLGQGAGVHVVTGTVSITNSIVTSYTTGISTTDGTVTEDYNLFSDNTTNIFGPVTSGGNSFDGNPDFVDPAGRDYHLQSTSDAIDAGVDAGVTVDRDGNVRPSGSGLDIGAYEAQWYLLSISLAGTGTGAVSGLGIACPGDCTESLFENTVVTLTTTPDTDSTFTGWSGACTNTSGDCVVTMTEAISVTATFTKDEYLLFLPLLSG